MKKKILIIINLFVFTFLSFSQITTDPTLVVQKSGNAVTITFDLSQISTLSSAPGPFYVHTGVILSGVSDLTKWSYVLTPWPDGSNSSAANTSANLLTQVGTTSKYTLTISDINTYYGITDGDIVSKLAFVVRTASGSPQSSNLYVDVYQPGLNVNILSPTDNSLVALNAATTISTVASNDTYSCNIDIYVGTTSTSNITNTTPVKSGTSVNTLSTTWTPASSDNYYIITKATSNGLTKYDTAYVCVPKTIPTGIRPSGTQEGVTFNNNGTVTFCLSLVRGAPVNTTTMVYLLGDFNNWKIDNNYMMNLQLENTTYGVNTNFYYLTVPGLDPNKEYAYQYYVDGLTSTSAVKIGDPYCEKILDPSNDQYINQSSTVYPNLKTYPSNASGIVSCIQKNAPTYTWQYTSSFIPPAQNNLMIYELLFRDFTKEGTVQAAIKKLDYLQQLGINAIELMPIMEFDGNNSWGYNPNFYFAPDKAYGTKTDYQEFIDECHKRGMAVILDVVFNHTWGLSPYCLVYWDSVNNRPLNTNPYYNPISPHPYGVGNDLRHDRTFVRSWLERSLKWWLSEYKVDGFRFDLSKGFTQTQSGTNVSLWGNYDANRVSYLKEYSDAIKSTNSNAYVILEHFADTDEEDALASYNNMMLWRNENSPYVQAAIGWGGNGQSSTDFSGIIGTNRVGYACSHDEERLAARIFSWGQDALKNDTANAMKQLSVTPAFIFLSPGPRMMWMFDELGYNYPTKDSNGSNNTAPKPVHWEYADDARRQPVLLNYAKVLNFRKNNNDIVGNSNWTWLVGNTDWNNGKWIKLQNSDFTALVVGNFTGTGSIVATPGFTHTGTWYNYISGNSLIVTNISQTVNLDLGELAIFTDKELTPVGLPVADTSTKTTKAEQIKVFPTFTSDKIYIETSIPIQQVKIYNLQGNVVKNLADVNEISLNDVPQGIYFVEIKTSQGKSIQKIIKNK